MKNLLLALLVMIGMSAFAQPDIEVTLMSPAASGSIVSGTQFNFDVKIENKGTVAIDAMDTIIFASLIKWFTTWLKSGWKRHLH
ncbi:MAG: hypothetical protein U5L96_22165 [Owenweeksia sp.]|nr:hypothetical protein [Owenweeksia sp.]